MTYSFFTSNRPIPSTPGLTYLPVDPTTQPPLPSSFLKTTPPTEIEKTTVPAKSPTTKPPVIEKTTKPFKGPSYLPLPTQSTVKPVPTPTRTYTYGRVTYSPYTYRHIEGTPGTYTYR